MARSRKRAVSNISSRAHLPWIRLTEALKIVMEDEIPVTSSVANSGAPSLSPRALGRIAGEVAAILRGPPTSSSFANPLSLPSTSVFTSSTSSGTDISYIYLTSYGRGRAACQVSVTRRAIIRIWF